MHFNVRAGQKPCGALDERTGIGDVHDVELPSGAEPGARQRFSRLWPTARRRTAFDAHQNPSTHSSRAAT